MGSACSKNGSERKAYSTFVGEPEKATRNEDVLEEVG
jgi:hypothetical protein